MWYEGDRDRNRSLFWVTLLGVDIASDLATGLIKPVSGSDWFKFCCFFDKIGLAAELEGWISDLFLTPIAAESLSLLGPILADGELSSSLWDCEILDGFDRQLGEKPGRNEAFDSTGGCCWEFWGIKCSVCHLYFKLVFQAISILCCIFLLVFFHGTIASILTCLSGTYCKILLAFISWTLLPNHFQLALDSEFPWMALNFLSDFDFVAKRDCDWKFGFEFRGRNFDWSRSIFWCRTAVTFVSKYSCCLLESWKLTLALWSFRLFWVLKCYFASCLTALTSWTVWYFIITIFIGKDSSALGFLLWRNLWLLLWGNNRRPRSEVILTPFAVYWVCVQVANCYFYYVLSVSESYLHDLGYYCHCHPHLQKLLCLEIASEKIAEKKRFDCVQIEEYAKIFAVYLS